MSYEYHIDFVCATEGVVVGCEVFFNKSLYTAYMAENDFKIGVPTDDGIYAIVKRYKIVNGEVCGDGKVIYNSAPTGFVVRN